MRIFELIIKRERERERESACVVCISQVAVDALTQQLESSSGLGSYGLPASPPPDKTREGANRDNHHHYHHVILLL